MYFIKKMDFCQRKQAFRFVRCLDENYMFLEISAFFNGNTIGLRKLEGFWKNRKIRSSRIVIRSVCEGNEELCKATMLPLKKALIFKNIYVLPQKSRDRL